LGGGRDVGPQAQFPGKCEAGELLARNSLEQTAASTDLSEQWDASVAALASTNTMNLNLLPLREGSNYQHCNAPCTPNFRLFLE
jgi:hypothetical protein